MTREEIKKAMRDTKREIVIKNLHKLLSLVEGYPEYEDCISYAIAELEQKPTTNNCESCRYYGSHHEVCNYCYKCSLWTEQEPTTKNDDCISRQAVLEQAYAYGNGLEPDGYCVNVEDIQALPPITPQEPKTGYWIEHSTEEDYSVCSRCGIGSRRMEHGKNADELNI